MTQARDAEDASNMDFLEFLGKSNDMSNVRNMTHYHKFDHVCSDFNKSNKKK